MEPEITKAEMKNFSNQYGYIKNGETATLELEFSEELSTKPSVKIGGREATVTGSGKTYKATYYIPENEETLEEGELSIEVSNYTDLVGLKGKTLSQTTDGSKIIYDRTAPTINSIEPDGNSKWQKSQSIVISATDNIAAKKDITGKYQWIKEDEQISDFNNTFVNEAKITKDTDTGKYKLYVIMKDLAGNEKMVTSKQFFIDNSVTNIGTISITKGSLTGETYKTHETTASNGIVYEGGYTQENLYIHKNDGTDEESGHQRTEYKIAKIENGKEIAIGGSRVEDTLIQNDGDYKITVTSYDNLGNAGSRVYLIHRGTSNVTFSPDGNSNYEVKVSTKVTLTDATGLNSKMYYQWVKEGEEPENFTQTLTSGRTITLTGVKGEYALYIKTVDKDGNENICKSNTFKIAGTISNMGSMIFQYNDENGEEYKPDDFTKENIYMKIKDHGSDDIGGKVTSTYKINKKEENGSTTFLGEFQDEVNTLISEGEYTITLTSTTELGASNSINYNVKIDKTSPNMEFYGLDIYQNTGIIQVKITDEGFAQSGVNVNCLKYYWTRSKNTPTKEDFEGEENEYRGTLNNTSAVIKTPQNVSGVWYLWVYAEDNAGNISIKSNVKIEGGNVSFVDNEAPIPGTIKMTEETEERKIYEENTFTNQSIRIALLSGYDADSGVKSNTYSIKKDGNAYKSNLTEETVLTENGTYTVIVTTIDNKDNQAIREYTIKIDKQGPNISYNITNQNDYSMKKEVEVTLEDENGSGVNHSKTIFQWVGYHPNFYENIEKVLEEINESKQIYGEEKYIEELEKLGIFIQNAQAQNNKVITPEKATGIYYLLVYSEDNMGNSSTSHSEALKLDNTSPTKPEVYGFYKESKEGYYGELTNKEIQIEVKNSESLSGVDQYKYTTSKDNGETWSEWKEAEYKEQVAKIMIAEEGNTIIKIKAVAQLLDGTLESEESKFTVRIDKTGPSVTFSNYENGENGSNQVMKSILVRITATEQNSNAVNPNTLKYEWVKFADIEEYNQYANREKTWEDLRNKMTENAKPFSNGEEVPSPENANGIYSLFVYSEDMTGNASIHYSNSYRLTNGSNGSQDEDSTLGDINGDGVIDLIDLSRLQQHIIGRRILSEEEYRKADLNQDGEVDILDLSKTMFIIVSF